MMNLLISLEPLILVLHVLVCVFLAIVILLQAGKGADIGASFGAGGSQSLFGARGGATFLSKVTTVVAFMFLATSISLATIKKNALNNPNGASVIDTAAPSEPLLPPSTGNVPVEQKSPSEEKAPAK